MAIRFTKDYRVVGSSPPEVYSAGQVVKDLSEASENHFIIRGAAVREVEKEPAELKSPAAPKARKPAQ